MGNEWINKTNVDMNDNLPSEKHINIITADEKI